MTLIEPGRICVITKGRDAGKEVVIKEIIDKNFVKIAGETVKERRSNIKHLEITARKVTKIPTGKVPKIKEKKVQKEKQTKEEEKKKEKPKEKKEPKEKPKEEKESKADAAAREILEEAMTDVKAK